MNPRLGQLVEVPDWKGLPGPRVGNITQVTRYKVRVLLPIHRYVWLYKTSVKGVHRGNR